VLIFFLFLKRSKIDISRSAKFLSERLTKLGESETPCLAREPVDQVVLAALCFIGDDDNVADFDNSRAFRRFSSGVNFWMVVNSTPPNCVE
jgi:hypothetical protein